MKNKSVIKQYFNLIIKVLFFKKNRRNISKFKIILIIFLTLLSLYLLIPLGKLFPDDYSTVITDKNNTLLGATISGDGQWRFPRIKKIPPKIEKCVINFEDKNFYYHPGIDPLSLCRAFYTNIKKKKIISGGSTIPMQVIRLAGKNKNRTIFEKIIEAFLAIKLSISYSKINILKIYLSNAPYGGNVVGLEAASWRYFGRNPDNLSWSESALLAVLPNNPSMLYPGKNTDELKKKRNFLLSRLYTKKIITKNDYELAIDEELPKKPNPIPQTAQHLLNKSIRDGHKGEYITTTLDINYQERSAEILEKYHNVLKLSQIHNACMLIIKVKTGEVLAYIGNTKEEKNNERYSNDVDIVTSKRSPGSSLKPLLYSMALSDGLILPDSLIPDVPLSYEGFAPKNMSKQYDGAVKASDALIRSLNVPFVNLLKNYGYQKFYYNLEKLGITFDQPSSHYALSLILGGAEVTLWDLSSIYAGFSRTAGSNFKKNLFFKNIYTLSDKNKYDENEQDDISFDKGVIWLTIQAMKELNRPNEEQNWKRFNAEIPVAWKTGTSYGNKDAWSIGFNSEYLVGVWVGNASGEGRPEIKGVTAAAPIMFDIFDFLPETTWFTKPSNKLKKVLICKQSGMLTSKFCDDVEEADIQDTGEKSDICPYHRIVHFDEKEKFQVDGNEYPVSKMVNKVWFVLPPVMEWYYKKVNSKYKVLPPFINHSEKAMSFIYPPNNKSKIYVPIELDGTPGKTVFEITHKNPEDIVYWHLDDEFIGMTKTVHQFGFFPKEGKHKVIAVDEKGNVSEIEFTILEKRR